MAAVVTAATITAVAVDAKKAKEGLHKNAVPQLVNKVLFICK